MAWSDIWTNLTRQPSDSGGRFNVLSPFYGATAEGSQANKTRMRGMQAAEAGSQSELEGQHGTQATRRAIANHPTFSNALGFNVTSPEDRAYESSVLGNQQAGANVAATEAGTAYHQEMTRGQHLDQLEKQAVQTWLQTHYPHLGPSAASANIALQAEKNPAEIASLMAGAEHAGASAKAVTGEEGRKSTEFGEQSGLNVNGMPFRQASAVQGMQERQTRMNTENARQLAELFGPSFGFDTVKGGNPMMTALVAHNPTARAYVDAQKNAPPTPAKAVDAMTRRPGFGQETTGRTKGSSSTNTVPTKPFNVETDMPSLSSGYNKIRKGISGLAPKLNLTDFNGFNELPEAFKQQLKNQVGDRVSTGNIQQVYEMIRQLQERQNK